MQLNDLHVILKGDIARIDEVDVRDVALYADNVPVYPSDVRNMLKRYLIGDITSDELSKWAAFLCIRGEYSCPNKTSDDEDFYEAMWDVVQALSVPEIDGEITEERVRQYLSELEKYGDE